jgi:hypothetical protein
MGAEGMHPCGHPGTPRRLPEHLPRHHGGRPVPGHLCDPGPDHRGGLPEIRPHTDMHRLCPCPRGHSPGIPRGGQERQGDQPGRDDQCRQGHRAEAQRPSLVCAPLGGLRVRRENGPEVTVQVSPASTWTGWECGTGSATPCGCWTCGTSTPTWTRSRTWPVRARPPTSRGVLQLHGQALKTSGTEGLMQRDPLAFFLILGDGTAPGDFLRREDIT